MLKIAQLSCVYPPYKGGIGNAAYEFQNQLKDLGYDPVIFTPFYLKSNIKEKKVIRLKPILKTGNAAFLPQLFFLLRKFDIIILHYPFYGAQEIVTLFKLFYRKKKLIIHFHMDVVGLSFWGKILSIPSRLSKNMLFSLADAVTCASLDYLKNSSLLKLYNENKKKFIELSFGVDQKIFHPASAGSSINYGNGSKTILFVGGLDRAHYFKGLKVLILAISRLPKNIDCRLKIAGSGELQNDYEEYAKETGIYDKIDFMGNLDTNKLAELYRQSHLFILPSINKCEAFGLVLLEAMASGLPVIASNLPGVRQVFKDNDQGYLVRPGDAIDLEEKIEKILLNNELRNMMSEKALDLVKEKYSWKRAGENLHKIILNLDK